MSKPAAGTYYIVNRVTSPTGEDLAITFNGQGNIATVTPLTHADSQKWKIVNYVDGVNQSFSPATAPSLQAGIDGLNIVVIPAGGYVYFARTGSTGLSIQGGNGGTQSWTIFSANENWEVKFTYGEGGDKSFWVLRSV